MQVDDRFNLPFVKSLTTCLNHIIADGFAEDFKISDTGLIALQQNRHYTSTEVSIVNCLRFEETSNTNANAILYVIETKDGIRGTLIDMFAGYRDLRIGRFINEIRMLQKI